MLGRLVNLSKTNSFFLFGARGTGKTSLLKSLFNNQVLYLDLLNLDLEALYQLDPEHLYRQLSALSSDIRIVIIDEIQKVPKLLDVVHRKIEESSLIFILTGSSARKLKSGAANLLAGRAFVFHLYPLLAKELGDRFDLNLSLSYGTLPAVWNFTDNLDRRRFLKSYSNTYLKEEVWGEQLVREMEPFRRFLQVAAQQHGQIINYSKISRDVGVDDSTVKNYFSILEDTLVGFYLPAYSGSERKQLKSAPKFYLFDNGVMRALSGQIDYELVPGSSEYGMAFEQFIIAEIMRRVSYLEIDLKFSFLATEGGAEIDLVISQGKKTVALIEIKSSNRVSITDDLKHLRGFTNDFKKAMKICLYNGEIAMEDEGIQILPWLEGIEKITSALTPQN
jgi:predicted AAA+ superfamily ATPase